MSQTTIIDNEFATLWYHVETKIVHHSIKQYVTGAHLRELLETGQSTLKKNQAIKWLSDDLKNGPITPDDEEWAVKVWFPKALEAGFRHWAIVKPAKVLGQLNMRRYKETYAAAGVNAELFSEVAEAMKWLEQQ
jgi:hypothetical protein